MGIRSEGILEKSINTNTTGEILGNFYCRSFTFINVLVCFLWHQ